MVKKRILTVTCILSIFLLLCSCSNYTQIRDRAIIEAMAIDYKDGKYVVTLKEHPNSKEEKPSFIKSSGTTLYDALKNAESNDGKQVFYAHSGVFIIGENAAGRGFEQVLEFMNSNYQISLNSSVLFTPANAEEILREENFSKNDSDFLIKRIEDLGKSVDVTVIDALKMSYNLGGHLYLPQILSDGENGVKIENCVVFKQNKPQCYLDSEQTMGLNLLLGKVRDGVFVTRQQNRRISVNIASEKLNVVFKFISGAPVLQIDIKTWGNISEFGVIGDEEERKSHLKNLQQDIESQIRDCVMNVLKKTVNYEKCDIINVKQMIKNAYPDENTDNIDDILKNMKFDVNVKFTVRHSGIQVK